MQSTKTNRSKHVVIKCNRKNIHRVLLHLLFAICLTPQLTYPFNEIPIAIAAAATASLSAASPSGSNANAGGTDLFYIRHGRSRVRHSNEKDHLRRDVQVALTNITIQDMGSPAKDELNTMPVYGSSISSGNEQLFDSDFWQNSEANDTQEMLLVPPTEQSVTRTHAPMPTLEVATTTAPVTHKIRKLHKKKIMESIRKSVADKGVKWSKNHRSLAEAEQMQGRLPVALDEIDRDDIDGELLDDIESEAAAMNEVGYQNDDYLTTFASIMATPPTVTAAATFEPDVSGIQSSSETDEFEDDNDTDGDAGDDDNDDEISADDEKTQIKHGNGQQITDFVPKADAIETRRDAVSTEKPMGIHAELKKYFHLNDTFVGLIAKNRSLVNNGKNAVTKLHKIEQQAHEGWSTKQQQLIKQTKQGNKAESTLIAAKSKAEDSTEADYSAGQQSTQNEENYVEAAVGSLVSENPTKSLAVDGYENVSDEPSIETSPSNEWGEAHSIGPSHLASTSVGGIGLDRQQSIELEEINFDDVGLDNSQDTMDDGIIDNRHDNRYPPNTGGMSVTMSGSDDDIYETNKFLEGVVDAANEDEIYDWDEISRNNRRNLMRGRDVVTKFLQIVETQHSLGSNCEAGTSLNLGEGVVDRYAQDRFRVEAEVAVNRANMLTRIFKMTSPSVQSSVNLLHASVLSMVEFDDDIFGAGNCFDWNQHPSQPGLFCPFAYRLPPPNLGAIFAKDLATEYHYLGNTSEWFFQARKNAEKVIARNEQYLKAFHLYSNKTEERIEMDTLAVKYEDGRWSKPYYDCGGGNIWMLTYTVPFFGYENGTYIFKGTSGIDIDLRRVDIDQCPQRSTHGATQPLNIFAGTDKCKQRTTMCEALKGLGFRRGSYKCVCRKGYYFPDTISMYKFFNGSQLEEEYEKLMLGKNSTYNIVAEYECLPCAEGCDSCEDGSPCIAALNWPMRTSILVLACTVIGLLPPAAWFTFRYQQVKVVRAASPALLRVIALGAFFIYCTTIVMYPNPNLYTCTARIWLREIGFSLTYGALMLKTWRISVIFRVRSAKAVKITDAALLKRLGIICGVIGTCLLVRTLVSPPDVVVGRTADDLKAFLCKTDWWDYTFTSMEVFFLAWGVRLCIMVRKAPSEFNESRFISMAIYNEFLLTCFLNVSMLFLQSPANPDLLYIIFFCHTQLTVTLLLGLIFGSKVYIVLRSGKSHQENIGMGAKQSGAKFNFRPQVRTFANPSSVTTSTAQIGGGTTSAETKLSDQEALEEIRQLSVQLQRIQEMAPPKGVAVMTISSLLDGLKTPGGMIMVAAAAGVNQLSHRQEPSGSLPLLAIANDMHTYNHKLLLPPQNNNLAICETPTNPNLLSTPVPLTTTVTAVTSEEKSVNTSLCGDDFRREVLPSQAYVVCGNCLDASKAHYYTYERPWTPTLCEQLGSPQPEGSISFSNIKLDCMCSQPDDLDRQHNSTPTHSRRRVNYRTAATNTPPLSSSTCRRRSKTKGETKFHHGSSSSLSEAQKMSDAATATTTDSVVAAEHCDKTHLPFQRSDSEIFQICDNCKNKLSSRKSSSKNSSIVAHQSKALKLAKKTIATKTTKIASEPKTGPTITGVSKRLHSTDDVTFYTTTDDGSDIDDLTDACSNQRRHQSHRKHQLIFQSTSALSSSTAIETILSEKCTPHGPIEPSTSSSSIAGSCIAAESIDTHAAVEDTTTCHSDGSASANSNGSTNDNTSKTNGRSKRPDKLMLDLNDRSKYTKEVSV